MFVFITIVWGQQFGSGGGEFSFMLGWGIKIPIYVISCSCDGLQTFNLHSEKKGNIFVYFEKTFEVENDVKERYLFRCNHRVLLIPRHFLPQVGTTEVSTSFHEQTNSRTKSSGNSAPQRTEEWGWIITGPCLFYFKNKTVRVGDMRQWLSVYGVSSRCHGENTKKEEAPSP